ncbi:hypothetical protein AYI70_g10789 [Smittium culicis]|uniref:Uncharacterized protein n=1 Tax=Smittium culicis TaxID=133412 RepID=A0A1R1X4Y0_9FUNG|nr:hypothetical protein AYI70_g10789 [Smittium culicis]
MLGNQIFSEKKKPNNEEQNFHQNSAQILNGVGFAGYDDIALSQQYNKKVDINSIIFDGYNNSTDNDREIQKVNNENISDFDYRNSSNDNYSNMDSYNKRSSNYNTVFDINGFNGYGSEFNQNVEMYNLPKVDNKINHQGLHMSTVNYDERVNMDGFERLEYANSVQNIDQNFNAQNHVRPNEYNNGGNFNDHSIYAQKNNPPQMNFINNQIALGISMQNESSSSSPNFYNQSLSKVTEYMNSPVLYSSNIEHVNHAMNIVQNQPRTSAKQKNTIIGNKSAREKKKR